MCIRDSNELGHRRHHALRFDDRRQLFEARIRHFDNTNRRFDGTEGVVLRRYTCLGQGIEPVSYTHLDVYKRQPLAEETGLILPLGAWVLTTACNQLVSWSSDPAMANLTLAVNVSARQFRQPDFVGQVLTTLETSSANPTKLKLELTESLLLDNVEEIILKMNALRSSGVSFALDDFGTGYSSLSYLKRLPLNQLKIDQTFVRDVLSDPNDAAIARTIVALAQSLGPVSYTHLDVYKRQFQYSLIVRLIGFRQIPRPDIEIGFADQVVWRRLAAGLGKRLVDGEKAAAVVFKPDQEREVVEQCPLVLLTLS